MKAKPVKLIYGQGYVDCPKEEATHLQFKIPGPSDLITLPIILKGKREGTNSWTWNGDIEKPTLRPSVLNQGHNFLGGDPKDKSQWIKFRCHTWINDGKAQFLDDCDHEFRGQTVDLLDITENNN